jgi:hypothetical protein
MRIIRYSGVTYACVVARRGKRFSAFLLGTFEGRFQNGLDLEALPQPDI